VIFPKRILSLTVALATLSSVASAYYHFVYFPVGGPFVPINLQFDLTKLSNNTVYYFISDQGPNVFVPGDSFTAEISELQLAAQAWNGVPSSQIKLAYGGLESASTQQSSPGIDVVFSDDIPAGLLAQTKVTTYANVSFANSGTAFLPILRSQIQFQKNLTITVPQQASFYDSSFTTMVHEFGHSLGLQHTLTSATMATYLTRSTTKAMPLAADDIAGISLLYPTPGYLATTGSITGSVTLNGGGVNLASVVALSPTTGAAISTLTNPDGSYAINAVPPGTYLLYVNPLPPSAEGESGPDGLVLPQDTSLNTFAANTGFVTQFFPGTRDWTQAYPLTVTAGNVVQFANFNVQASAGPVIYGMALSGYLNNVPEAMPMLPANGGFSLVFTAPGTTAGNAIAPTLNVSVIGATAPASVVPGYTKYYEKYDGFSYDSMGIYTSQVQSTTPVALAFTVSNDLYVLPAAFYVVQSGAPTLTALNRGTDGNGNPTLTVYGNSLSTSTQFVFDGTPAIVPSGNVNPDGSFTLSVPSAPANYSSSIEALNPDGQTTGQAIPFGNPPQYLYSYVNPATIQISPSQAVPGTDMMVQISGNNTNFNAQTTVGFGSSDIVVKQVFVVSSNLLRVNISINAAAPQTLSTVTVTTGLQTATLSATLGLGMQIVAPVANQISMVAPVLNALTGLPGVPSSGGTLVINLYSTPANINGWTLTVGNEQVVPSYSNGQITASLPAGLSTGTVIVQLIAPNSPAIPPIAMKIDAPPPVIGSIVNASGASVSATTLVHPGDVLTVNVANFGDGITPVVIPNIFVSADAVNGQNGISVPVTQLAGSTMQVQIPFSTPNNPSSPLTVGIGTRVSLPAFLNIHN
jgi:hypothetical protein